MDVEAMTAHIADEIAPNSPWDWMHTAKGERRRRRDGVERSMACRND
jgi:hypothetical protein